MSEKKQSKHKEEVSKPVIEEVQAAPENAGQAAPESLSGMVENAEQANAELETLLRRLEQAEAKVAEHLDGWQRAQAEFINYKNRVQRDQDLMKVLMKGDIIKKFLPALDDLERALQNRPADSGAWVGGIELIQKKIQSILESEGVTRIEAEGREFDPNFHEAISHEAVQGVESGHVIAVVQNGYIAGDRVLRPALVRVAQ